MNRLENLGALNVDLLHRLSSIATRLDVRLFLIGGSVRDLLLNRAVTDLDIMVDGKLGEFAEGCQKEWHSLFPGEPLVQNVIRFEKYFTAKLQFEIPFRNFTQIDLSQARKESYPQSGQKPIVQAGTLETDIQRRDFTLNSLAVEFYESKGSLVDLCRGEEDLKSLQLRLHHDHSFIDDPIRLVRAVRFISRFGFTLEPRTSELFCQSVEQQMLGRVPVQRRFDEFRKVLSESEPKPILAELHSLGLLGMLCPLAAVTAISTLPSKRGWVENLKHLVALIPKAELDEFLRKVQLSKMLREEILS